MCTETRLTRLIQRLDDDDPATMEQLMAAVYADLEAMAEDRLQKMYGDGLAGITLEPAAIVNETYLRLIHQQAAFKNRKHFFAVISRIMLRVLIDYHRGRDAQKRPDKSRRIGLSIALRHLADAGSNGAIGVEEFEAALNALEGVSPRKADVAKMRIIWGMTHEQAAESLGVSPATVERDWAFAKPWMLREVHRMRDGDAEQESAMIPAEK